MSPLLALLPGGAQAALILKTLGITQKEEKALGSVMESASQLPILRALPAEIIPKAPRDLIAWVTGLKAAGVVPQVPAGLVRVMDNPMIRSAVASEIERFVDGHPQKKEIYSVIGKAISHLWPDADVASTSTLTEVMDKIVFERLFNAPPTTSVFMCRECGYTQVVTPAPLVTCRQCHFVQQVKSYGTATL